MRKAYLEEHRPGLYDELFLFVRLYEHLADIDQSSAAGFEVKIPAIAAAEGVDEALKVREHMAWVAEMNSIRHRAEEVILSELVFG